MLQSERIAEKAKALGFDAVGFTAPKLPARAVARFQEFIANNEHGDMHWMAERMHLRADPAEIWPEAKSIIMLGHNYGPEENPLEKLGLRDTGLISAYAQHRDYHDVMKKRMRELAAWMTKEFACDVKLFVDTAPVMEKPLAEAAGLGWQGKHTCVVSREFGSWLFLGGIFTTLDLLPSPNMSSSGLTPGSIGYDEKMIPRVRFEDDGDKTNHCGTCTQCIDICPTQAIVAEGKLDATRCIAYLTIEHKGHIPLEYRKAIGNRVYGCDDCLSICPWNKFAKTSSEAAYHAREELKAPKLSMLLELDDAAFRQFFSGSPVKRTGRNRFIRNVLIAAGNSEDKSLLPAARKLQADENDLVREAAAWAVAELEKLPI